MWGVTKDETWVFLDPCRQGLCVQVAHIAEEVDHLILTRMVRAHTVIRFEAIEPCFTIPPISLHTCASVCGATVGIRAWSPASLQRKLLENGGEIQNAKIPGD